MRHRVFVVAVIGSGCFTACQSREYNPSSEARQNNTVTPPAPAPDFASDAFSYKESARIKIPKPAFVDVAASASGQTGLFVSSFGAGGEDAVRYFSTPTADPKVISSKVTWPNGASYVPAAVFGTEKIAVAGGFLVPFKDGTVTIFDPSDTSNSTGLSIVKKRSSTFYHQVEWVDMNGDGRLDCVTARAFVPIIKLPILTPPTGGELVWLENPGGSEPRGDWKEHVLAKGPDVHFVMEDVDGDGNKDFIAAQFFTKSLTIFWGTKGGVEPTPTVVDGVIGSAFNLEYVDLDGDGKKEILATNHETNEVAAGVFAYIAPSDPRRGTWDKKPLARGFKTEKTGRNQASPGTARAFFAKTSGTSGKPAILVSGDGARKFYALVPRNQTVGDWTYEKRELLDLSSSDSVTGDFATHDFDGDGWNEIYVPAYHDNSIRVLTRR